MRKWIALLIVVGVLIIIGFGINKLISNGQEKVFLEHRDMIYETKKELNIIKLQDDLVTLGYATASSLGVTNTSYLFFSNNASYSRAWSMDDIQDDIIDYYLDYAEECGISDDSFLSCKLEDEEALYKFTKTNDRTVIEIYRYSDNIEYMKLDYTTPEDIILYNSVTTREGDIVSGQYYHYLFQDNIEFYEIRNNEVTSYEKFLIVDGYKEFTYRFSSPHDNFFFSHTARFWDEDIRMAFTFDFISDTNEMRNYHIDFYDIDDNQILHLTYEEGEIASFYWDDDHLGGWLEFYNSTCLDNVLKQTEPYVGLCEYSTYSSPRIEMNDYLGEDLEDMLSLEVFGLDFTDISIEDIEYAETYLLTHYQDVYTNNNFDYTNRNISQFAFFNFISPDTARITQLLGEQA